MGRRTKNRRGGEAPSDVGQSAVQQGFGSISKQEALAKERTQSPSKRLSTESQDKLTMSILALSGLLILGVLAWFAVPAALQQLGIVMDSNRYAAPNVRFVLASDTVKSRNVFSGGFPHVVLCQNGTELPMLP